MDTDRGTTKVRPLPAPTPEERQERPTRLVPREDARASDNAAPAPAATGPSRPLARIEAMGAEECRRAYRSGRLTRAERAAWAAAYPDEVPMVNDEFEWIGLLAE
jgi:hypothetical protein